MPKQNVFLNGKYVDTIMTPCHFSFLFSTIIWTYGHHEDIIKNLYDTLCFYLSFSN